VGGSIIVSSKGLCGHPSVLGIRGRTDMLIRDTVPEAWPSVAWTRSENVVLYLPYL
jgi:hypothetical protein